MKDDKEQSRKDPPLPSMLIPRKEDSKQIAKTGNITQSLTESTKNNTTNVEEPLNASLKKDHISETKQERNTKEEKVSRLVGMYSRKRNYQKRRRNQRHTPDNATTKTTAPTTINLIEIDSKIQQKKEKQRRTAQNLSVAFDDSANERRTRTQTGAEDGGEAHAYFLRRREKMKSIKKLAPQDQEENNGDAEQKEEERNMEDDTDMNDESFVNKPGAFAMYASNRNSSNGNNNSFIASDGAFSYQSKSTSTNSGSENKLQTSQRQQQQHHGISTTQLVGSYNSQTPVTATIVNEDDLEQQLRETIFSDAVPARVLGRSSLLLHLNSEASERRQRRLFRSILVLLGLSLTAVVIIVVFYLSDRNNDNQDDSITDPISDEPTVAPTYYTPPIPTIQSILDRNALNCVLAEEEHTLKNFTKVLCQAVTAALFGEHYMEHLNYITVPFRSLFSTLQTNKTMDMISSSLTHTMERDIYESSALAGFSFTEPYLYEGIQVAGIPKYVDCVDDLQVYNDDCKDLRICVCDDCTHTDRLMDVWFPNNRLVLVETSDMYQKFADGVCNVLAQERAFVAKQSFQVAQPNYDISNYKVGEKHLSKEPLGMVTRDDDIEWSKFCTTVIQILFAAEKYNVTQDSADTFQWSNIPTIEESAIRLLQNTTILGTDLNLRTIIVNIIQAVGNYHEIYEENLQSIIPRQGLDEINTRGDTGIIYTLPFGNLKRAEPSEIRGRLKSIVNRGYLICGIMGGSHRKGLATKVVYETADHPNGTISTWIGMDAEYCRALAASLFPNSTEQKNIHFEEIMSEDEGFELLSNQSIDALLGAPYLIERSLIVVENHQDDDVFIDFSIPYFYNKTILDTTNTELNTSDGIAKITPLALATARSTNEPGNEWSDFCKWVVMCTFFAEETGVRKDTYYEMPQVSVFGSTLQDMFLRAIREVGNYEQIYKDHMEEHVSREEHKINKLNEDGPQHLVLL